MELGDLLDGKYRLIRQISSGGMGTVYAATRVSLGDTVAVKLILPSQNSTINRARFLREAQAAARIRHPNVVQIFDFGDAEVGVPYIVMEFLDGRTLYEELYHFKRLPVPRALDLLRQICSAVEAGHRRGVLHRDLKTSNIMLARMDDGRETVKVLDFGLARLIAADHTPQEMTLTNPGALLGTYPYMSPEQVLGETVGPPSDVYALGVILYEMITGRLPYESNSPIVTLQKIVAGTYQRPREIVPDLPDALADAIEAALSMEAAGRPASPEALAEAAGAMMPSPSVGPPVTISGSAADLAAGTVVFSPATGQTQVPQLSQVPQEGVAAPAAPITATASAVAFAASRHASDWPSMTHFTGRDAEFEALRNEYGAALEGEGRLTIVVGEAGVGKSSLAKAFGAWARGLGACVLSGRFFDYEGSRSAPYEVFLTMIAAGREAFPSGESTPSQDLVDRLLEQAVGRGEGALVENADKWRTFAAVADEFVRIATRRPLVLVFDDLQWAGRLHLELLGYLHRALSGHPILVVGTARESDTHSSSGTDLASWLLALGNLRAYGVIPVRPFTEEQIRSWLNGAFGRLRIRPNDMRRLERATGGNPYYLLEVVRSLMTGGQVARHGDSWECASLERVALPETINNAVRAKLQGLDAEMRALLETASVVGDDLRFEVLQLAMGIEEEALEELVETAMRQQLLAESTASGSDNYRFFNKAIRRVVYDDLPARRRRRLHERVVTALQQVYSARRDLVAVALCYHYHAVGAWEETLQWGVRAGEEALARHDIDTAETSVSRSREALDHLLAEGTPVLAIDIARLDHLAGSLLSRLGRVEEAKALLRRAADVAEREGNASLLADALIDLSHCRTGRGEYAEAIAVAERAAEVAAAAGDRLRALTARVVAAGAMTRLDQHEEAAERFAEMLEQVSESEAPSLRALMLRSLAWTCIKQGAFAEGERLAREALELARTAGDPVAQQQALTTMAAAVSESGGNEAALPMHFESLRISRALSQRRREAIDLANIGESFYMLGRFDEAEANFEEALSIFVEIEDRGCEGDCRVNLGRALLARGHAVEGVVMLERGREICEATGRREYEGLALIAIGEARLAQGATDVAERVFTRAHELFAGFRAHHAWRAEYGLARVALSRGDRARARDCVELAVARIEEQRANLGARADADGFSRQVSDVYDLRAELG